MVLSEGRLALMCEVTLAYGMRGFGRPWSLKRMMMRGHV